MYCKHYMYIKKKKNLMVDVVFFADVIHYSLDLTAVKSMILYYI